MSITSCLFNYGEVTFKLPPYQSQWNNPNYKPKRLPRVSFLRPTRSTSQTPTRVNTKLVAEVAAASQMACLSSRTPAICRMVAL